MCTILLAWVNGKYKCNYEFLFVGAIGIDLATVATTAAYILK